MALNSPRVELEIGELVLHGVSPAGRHAVAEALHAELERLLAEPGAEARLARAPTLDRLHAGTVRMPRGARPERVGAALAGAVIAALSRQGAAGGMR